MAYNEELARRVRSYLNNSIGLLVIEKRMFGGLAFIINDKMCVNISGNSLMCRFNPLHTEQLSKRNGFKPMVMRGKLLSGYCYVEQNGFDSEKDFMFWIELCLEYNNVILKSNK